MVYTPNRYMNPDGSFGAQSSRASSSQNRGSFGGVNWGSFGGRQGRRTTPFQNNPSISNHLTGGGVGNAMGTMRNWGGAQMGTAQNWGTMVGGGQGSGGQQGGMPSWRSQLMDTYYRQQAQEMWNQMNPQQGGAGNMQQQGGTDEWWRNQRGGNPNWREQGGQQGGMPSWRGGGQQGGGYNWAAPPSQYNDTQPYSGTGGQQGGGQQRNGAQGRGSDANGRFPGQGGYDPNTQQGPAAVEPFGEAWQNRDEFGRLPDNPEHGSAFPSASMGTVLGSALEAYRNADEETHPGSFALGNVEGFANLDQQQQRTLMNMWEMMQGRVTAQEGAGTTMDNMYISPTMWQEARGTAGRAMPSGGGGAGGMGHAGGGGGHGGRGGAGGNYPPGEGQGRPSWYDSRWR